MACRRILRCPDTTGVTDWSKLACSQYLTDPDDLCNSVMAFEALG